MGSSRPFNDNVKNIRSKDAPRVEEGLSALIRLIDEDRANDLGAKAIVIDNGIGAVVGIIACKDCLQSHSRQVVSLALKLINKCADEANGRTVAAKAGAVPALLRLLADMSHIRTDSPADTKLTEDIAQTLLALTAVDPQKIILPGDIPEGSEAALRLIRSKNLDKILDMVSYDARSTTYIQSMVKCFANISQLGEGVEKLRDANAVERMLPLLQKPVVDIKESALMVLRNLVKYDAVARSQFFQQDPAQVLMPFLMPQHHKHAKVMANTLHILGDLLYRGKPAETEELEQQMIKLDLFEVLAACLGKDLPKATRDLIEEVLRIALEANKKGDAEVELDDKPWIKEKLKDHALAISKRRKQDQEEARQRAMEAQKQRQMMEMMAMQQMMGGEGGMEEMLAAMGGMGMGGMGYGDM
eukprot:GGOE01013809.1.p1 GENE.GGOE01013809.1~~GGOE01013809.1.p1  ORF type:complete len:450 (-),score=162.59 GGOE01013809.1:316-1560(-)